jgi:hypothetical protein
MYRRVHHRVHVPQEFKEREKIIKTNNIVQQQLEKYYIFKHDYKKFI